MRGIRAAAAHEGWALREQFGNGLRALFSSKRPQEIDDFLLFLSSQPIEMRVYEYVTLVRAYHRARYACVAHSKSGGPDDGKDEAQRFLALDSPNRCPQKNREQEGPKDGGTGPPSAGRVYQAEGQMIPVSKGNSSR
jgi:hypothetical protein